MKQKIRLHLLAASISALAVAASGCNEAEPPATDDYLRVAGGGGNRIFVRDRAKGFTFSDPQKVYAQNDTSPRVSDAGRNTLVKVSVFGNETRAY